MATEAAKAVDPPDSAKSPEQAGASPAALETTTAGIAVLAACAAPGRSRTRGDLPSHCGPPALTAPPRRSTNAPGLPAAAAARRHERTLTRRAMTRRSPTW
jgi:hypothetical protein